MNLWSSVRSLLTLPAYQEPDLTVARSVAVLDYADFDTQLAAVVNRRALGPWRSASIREALGVPSVFRAVSLIANTVGRLNIEAYRNGGLMPRADAPRLIVRPNPRATPRAFYRDSAYYLATRGECWWWVAVRDPLDNAPLSLVVVPPWEVTVEPNDRDRLRPTVKWLNKAIPLEDLRQITYLSDDANPYRGVGPLQLCGAAVSVAVEAQEWAANYFAGGISTTSIWTKFDLSEGEAQKLKAQWMEGTPNLPRIVPGDTVDKVEDDSPDPAKAQLTDTRRYSNGDAALMFGIPGALLEFAQSGTSLTYQNVQDLWRQFQEGCLTPYYLEPIEQEMSDLLTRSTVARFSLSGLLRADPMTRASIYNLLIPLGVQTVDEARQAEGWAPGDSEYAPVPFAPPQAVPDRLPIVSRSAEPVEVRCAGKRWLRGRLIDCDRFLGRLVAPYEVVCPRCKHVASSAA